MGNICPCPKRRKEKEFTYDVHEETFEIEEGPQIGEQSPKTQQMDNDTNILTEDLRMSDNGTEKSPELKVNIRENHSL